MARGPMQLHRLHQLKASPDDDQARVPSLVPKKTWVLYMKMSLYFKKWKLAQKF